jgi:hypothetical protein
METKPVAADVAVMDLVARELVEMLEAFPPSEDSVAWEDERLAARFRGRLALLPRLDARFVTQLLHIVRLDLEHEAEHIDWLLRNGGHKVAAPTDAHEDALRLLWPAVVEHLYQRKDDSRGLLKRAHLVQVCERAEERFHARSASLVPSTEATKT